MSRYSRKVFGMSFSTGIDRGIKLLEDLGRKFSRNPGGLHPLFLESMDDHFRVIKSISENIKKDGKMSELLGESPFYKIIENIAGYFQHMGEKGVGNRIDIVVSNGVDDAFDALYNGLRSLDPTDSSKDIKGLRGEILKMKQTFLYEMNNLFPR